MSLVYRSTWTGEGRRQSHWKSQSSTPQNFAHLSSSFKDISVGTSSARCLSRPFRCSAACRVCETTLTTSKFWLICSFRLPLWMHGSISPPTAHFTQANLCESSSCWQNFQLALLEFFLLKKKEQIPSFYPCIIWKMSNCRSLRICTREDFIKLKWEKRRMHQFVPKTYHGFWPDVVRFCFLWPPRPRKENSKNAAGRGNFKKMRVERTQIWTCFYDQIPRMQTARGRTNCLT